MKQTKNFNIMVPELGDTPDITQVSDAIEDLEDALAGTLEIMLATIQAGAVTLISTSRKTKRTGYYPGMSIGFIAPITIQPNTLKTVTVDGLPAQAIFVPYLVNAGEEVFIHYSVSGFTASLFSVPKSNSVTSDKTNTCATSRAVKIAYDKALEAFNFAKALCPYGVGDIYQTTNPADPATKWSGTKWDKLEGVYFKGTTGNEKAGLTGGSATMTLTEEYMAPHTHAGSGTTAEGGDHVHDMTHAHTGSQPEHTHNALHGHGGSQDAHAHDRGDMDIYGAHYVSNYKSEHAPSGAFAYASTGLGGHGSDSGAGVIYDFYASRHWTGGTNGVQPAVYVSDTDFNVSAAAPGITVDSLSADTGAGGTHEHTFDVSIAENGGGAAFSIEPPFYTVHQWLRTE